MVESEPKEHHAGSTSKIFEEYVAPASPLASVSSSLNLYRIGFDPHAISESAAVNNSSGMVHPANKFLRGLGGGSGSISKNVRCNALCN
jgi:hypothetical protein